MKKEGMDIEEAAKHIGVSVRTLRRWVAQGRVQARRVSISTGTRLEFDPQDLDGLQEKLYPVVIDDAERDGQPGGDTTCQRDDNLPEVIHPALPPVSLAIPDDLSKSLVRALDTIGQRSDSAGTPVTVSLEALPYLLTVEEVAAFLRVGLAKVRELLREGKLRGLRGLGRGWRIKREDLRRFMEKL